MGTSKKGSFLGWFISTVIFVFSFVWLALWFTGRNLALVILTTIGIVIGVIVWLIVRRT